MEIRRTTQKFTVNGKTYSSVEEMPPDVRTVFESTMGQMMVDKDRNGVPDILEGKAPTGNSGNSMMSVTRSTRFVVNGKAYNSLEEMPPETRKLFEAAERLAGEKKLLGSSATSANEGGMSFTKVLLILLVILVAVLIALIAMKK